MEVVADAHVIGVSEDALVVDIEGVAKVIECYILSE